MKDKIKIIICVTLLFISSLSFSQSKKGDYLVTEENDTVFCKIIGLSGEKIEYIKENEKSSSTKNIYSFIDVNITNLSVIKNPLGIKIEQPEKGYAQVYLYRPYAFVGSALNCKVEYNKTKLVNLKPSSYYIHRIKPNETHKYSWINSSKSVVEINAKEGEIYFIRGSVGADRKTLDAVVTFGAGMKIAIDNPKIARYMVLTMKKESPTN